MEPVRYLVIGYNHKSADNYDSISAKKATLELNFCFIWDSLWFTLIVVSDFRNIILKYVLILNSWINQLVNSSYDHCQKCWLSLFVHKKRCILFIWTVRKRSQLCVGFSVIYSYISSFSLACVASVSSRVIAATRSQKNAAFVRGL